MLIFSVFFSYTWCLSVDWSQGMLPSLKGRHLPWCPKLAILALQKKATEPELVPEMMSVLSKYPSAPAVLVRAARCEKLIIEVHSQSSFAMDDLFGKDKSFPKYKLGGGFKKKYIHPYSGKISNLTNMFQMG